LCLGVVIQGGGPHLRARSSSTRSSDCQQVMPGGGSVLSIWSSRLSRETLCMPAQPGGQPGGQPGVMKRMLKDSLRIIWT